AVEGARRALGGALSARALDGSGHATLSDDLRARLPRGVEKRRLGEGRQVWRLGNENPPAHDQPSSQRFRTHPPSEKRKQMTHIVATTPPKPGMREAFLKKSHANMPAVHAEKGCIEYAPAIDAEGIGSFQTKFGPDTFVVIEKWESPEALRAHATS